MKKGILFLLFTIRAVIIFAQYESLGSWNIINVKGTLTDKWSFFAHLPHDTDWSLNSYKKIYTVETVEETIGILETMPDILVKNCMLFLMLYHLDG